MQLLEPWIYRIIDILASWKHLLAYNIASKAMSCSLSLACCRISQAESWWGGQDALCCASAQPASGAGMGGVAWLCDAESLELEASAPFCTAFKIKKSKMVKVAHPALLGWRQPREVDAP